MSYESTDPVALGERLVEARKRKGLTQEQVAAALEISRPLIIAIEKGSRRPKPAELVKLSELYGESLNRLTRQGEGLPKVRPHLRAGLEAYAQGQPHVEDAINQLVEFVDDYQALEHIANTSPRTHFPQQVRLPPPPRPVERFAEHCAEQERNRLNLGDQPLIFIRKLLEEEVGLRIFYAPIHPTLAGLYAFVPNFGYCILINQKHIPQRRRWTIAHEYGHFLADRDRPGIDLRETPQRKALSERFADAFASAFLMPESGITRHFQDVIDRTKDFTVGDLLWLADLYAVSIEALTRRLESLSLIARGTWDELKRSGFKVGEARRELQIAEYQEKESAEPFPARYKILAVGAFTEGKLSEGQLAKFLRCSRLEAREMVQKVSSSWDTSGDSDDPIELTLTKSLLAAVEDSNAA